MIKRLTTLALISLTGACTFTQAGNNTPIVLTAATAPAFIKTEMQKGCAALMANPALVDAAVAAASKALSDTNGTVTTISNAASVGCSLLVPPPAAPAG